MYQADGTRIFWPIVFPMFHHLLLLRLSAVCATAYTGVDAPSARFQHKVEIMAKVKKKLPAAQKRARKKAKAERQKKYMWVFMNGKQVKVKRPATIEGMDPDEYIRQNADPIWLHQNEMWEYMALQENLWVNSGSGSSPIVRNSAISRTS